MEALQILSEIDKDLDWLKENLDSLKERYDQKFIAIKDSSIIAIGKSMDDIIRTLKDKGIDASKVLIQFISKIPVIL